MEELFFRSLGEPGATRSTTGISTGGVVFVGARVIILTNSSTRRKISFFILWWSGFLFFKTTWIYPINRIISDVGMEVELVFIANGICLQEPAERG